MQRRLTAAALLLLLAACDDGPAGPGAAPTPDPTPAAPDSGGSRTDLLPLSLFDVEMRVTGTPRPGQPVNVEVRVRSALPSRDAEITVRVPELDALRASGNGREFRMLRAEGASPRPAAAWKQPLSARQDVVHQTSVTFPQPGYYQVQVSATGTPDVAANRDVQTVTHNHVWVLVDEGGGRITPTFEPERLPEGAAPQPGPVRFREGGAPLGRLDTGTRSGTQMRANVNTSCMILGIFYCDAYLYVNYYDQDSGVYRPLAGATVTTEYWDRDPYTGQSIFVDERTQETDAQGRYHVDCTLYSYYTDQVVLTGSARLSNDAVTVQRNGSGTHAVSFNHGRLYDLCEYAAHGYESFWDVQVSRNQGRVFDNLVHTVSNSRSLTGYSRGHLTVRVNDTGSTSAYDSYYDNMVVEGTAIWGDFGRYAVAHEYGHALHEAELGGMDPYFCPGPYAYNTISSGPCAYHEGFADFHAALTIGMRMSSTSSAYSQYQAETGWRYFTGGASTSARVAAFLLDLADNAASPDNLAGDDDAAAYGAAYVATAYKNCLITWTEDITLGNTDNVVQVFVARPENLLDLVHCLEGQPSPNGRLSRQSSDLEEKPIIVRPTSVTPMTSATGWSRSTVQAIWAANITN